jgi:BED zinc finger
MHAWRCNHCIKDYLISHLASSTSNAKRHLYNKYSITLNVPLTLKRSREEVEINSEVRDSPQVKGLL